MATQLEIQQALREVQRSLRKVYKAVMSQSSDLGELKAEAKQKIDYLSSLQIGS